MAGSPVMPRLLDRRRRGLACAPDRRSRRPPSPAARPQRPSQAPPICSRRRTTAWPATTVSTTPSGEDVSIGVAWRATMMANSSRDPYWQAVGPARNDRPPEGRGGDRGRVRDLPHADVAHRGACAGRPAKVFAHLGRDANDAESRLAPRRRLVHALSPDHAEELRHSGKLHRRFRHRHDASRSRSVRCSDRSRPTRRCSA